MIPAKEGVEVASFLFGLLGGVIAWVVTSFFAQPLSTFFNLRAGTAKALARYEDRVDHNPEAPVPSADWLAERKRTYENCGADLVAFAVSNTVITRLLNRFPYARFRCYPRSAGLALLTLSEVRPGTRSSEDLREQVISALKLTSPLRKKRGEATSRGTRGPLF
jgi:hypothetical protein